MLERIKELRLYVPSDERTIDHLPVISNGKNLQIMEKIALYRSRTGTQDRGHDETRYHFRSVGPEGIIASLTSIEDYAAAVEIMGEVDPLLQERLFNSQRPICTDGVTVAEVGEEKYIILGIIPSNHRWSKGMLVGMPYGGMSINGNADFSLPEIERWDPERPNYQDVTLAYVQNLLGVKPEGIDFIGLSQFRHPNAWPVSINSKVRIGALPHAPSVDSKLVIVHHSADNLTKLLLGEAKDVNGELIPNEPIALGQIINCGLFDLGEEWYREATESLAKKRVKVFRTNF
jgi:hypothetical protein